MLDLAFSTKSLAVQKNVVIEEFKQVFLNQPYGDIWLKLRPMAYKEHPYKWATIGKEISHIENAKIQDVKEFFYSHYAPNNAILSLSGNIAPETAFNLSEKWFGPIEKRAIPRRNRRFSASSVRGSGAVIEIEGLNLRSRLGGVTPRRGSCG